MYPILLSCLFLTITIDTFPQVPTGTEPPQEVRAVWITTASSLDWPRGRDAADQQSSLRNIIADLKTANFNTIFFQVRPRGDAYYNSQYEPWAENLSGTLGKDPGWDPLALLLAEAHRQGLEVHAWFNVFKIRGPYTVKASALPHPTRAFPEWCVEHDGEVWFDPGIPEVTDYLIRVALDLVRKYDIDGILFDFLRYPDRSFRDRNTYARYGHGMDREDWRRSNIDRFVTVFHDSAHVLKPQVKIGACPLGIYDGVPNGDPLGSYHAQYQDSRGWLRDGKMDYLVPQVYWSIGSSPGSPDFAMLVRQWAQHSAGRHVYIGIGAYKQEVMSELPAQIDTVRAAGLAGHALYRYDNIRGFDVFAGRYDTPAIVPPMLWKDSALARGVTLDVVRAEDSGNPIVLIISLPLRTLISLDLLSQEGNGKKGTIISLENDVKARGIHTVDLASCPVKPGKYLLRLKAGTAVIEQPLEIRH